MTDMNVLREKLQLIKIQRDANRMNKASKEVADKYIKEKKKDISLSEKESKLKSEIYQKSIKGRTIKGISKAVDKVLSHRLKSRKVIREPNRVTIVENQPVYSRDKSRFFKTAWEEENRQLYFR